MVICNIVIDPNETYCESDELILGKYKLCSAIRVVDDITFLTPSPTIFYGFKNANSRFKGELDRQEKWINKHYCWTYNDSEISFENWLDKFVDECFDKYFKYVDSGIDVVFERNFDWVEFTKWLHPYPIIHEGKYEIYIADWIDGEDITIHSVKKDTLKYINEDPTKFIHTLYQLLDYEFLSIDAKSVDLSMKKKPIFLDDLLFANSNQWIGVDEVINNFSLVEIDRKKIIVYYLKQSAHLREHFEKYNMEVENGKL